MNPTTVDPELARAMLIRLVRRSLAYMRVEAQMQGTGIPEEKLRPVADALDVLAVQP